MSIQSIPMSKTIADRLKEGRSIDQWSGEIQNLSASQLKEMLEQVTKDLTISNHPVDAMDRLAEVLPLDKLQEAVRMGSPDFVNAIEIAKELFKEAQVCLNKQPSITLRAKLSSTIDTVISILDSFLIAFGVADFFKTPDGETEGEFKGQKIMMLLSLFSIISTSLIPLLGPALGGMIIGGTMLTLAVLSIIFPHIRPMPTYLPYGQNQSKQIREKQLIVADGRKKTLDDIARALTMSKIVKTHVMLLGQSGVGKTETIKAFAKAVERGDYEPLRGKQVFYFNMADLVSHKEFFGGGNKILSRINELLGRHRENIILVFDEIHLACQKRENTALADQLKMLLDPGNKKFPFVIGITTEDEYYRDIYVNNPAFARRFKRINVDNTDTEETLDILKRTFLQQAPRTILDQGSKTFSTLIDKSRANFGVEAPEPATSLKILTKCMQKTLESQKTDLELRVEKAQKDVQSCYLTASAANQDRTREERIELKNRETELTRLEADLKVEKEQLETFIKTRGALEKSKSTLYETALKTDQIRSNTIDRKHHKALNLLLVLKYFFEPALKNWIRNESERLHVRAIIDEALINEIINEEKENDRKVREAVERGKNQLAARTA